MTLDTNLRNLATRVSTETKSIRTLLNGNAADLSGLTTTAKANLVAAVNELDAVIDALINDAAAGNVTTSTYSASKITSLIAAAKSEILGGAGPAFDTLQELRDLLTASDAEDDAAISGIQTALGNRVRVDAAQAFTDPQKAQARSNIGAVAAADVGATDTDYVAIFEAGLA